MKYKLFVASYAYLETRVIGEEYVVVQVEPSNTDLYLEKVFDTIEQATPAIGEDCTLVSYKRRRKVTTPHNHTAYDPFHSEQAARSWLDEREAEVDAVEMRSGFESTVREIIIDQCDLEGYEYAPKYEVKLEVKSIKYITVEIDSEHHDDIEDGYDAGEKAKELCENGDYDSEIEYVSPDDFEVYVEDYDEV